MEKMRGVQSGRQNIVSRGFALKALAIRGQRVLKIKGEGDKATRHVEAHRASREGTVTREVSWLGCIPEVKK